MTENQFELHAVMAIVGVSLPVIGFLIAIVLTMRAKKRRENIIKEIYEEQKERKNGKGH